MNIKRLLLIAALALAVPFTSFADDKAPGKAAAAKPVTVTKATSPTSPKLLDINTASQKELEALPGIGPVKAGKIIAGRPYKGKDDLVSKKVLTAGDYAKVKDVIIAKQPK